MQGGEPPWSDGRDHWNHRLIIKETEPGWRGFRDTTQWWLEHLPAEHAMAMQLSFQSDQWECLSQCCPQGGCTKNFTHWGCVKFLVVRIVHILDLAAWLNTCYSSWYQAGIYSQQPVFKKVTELMYEEYDSDRKVLVFLLNASKKIEFSRRLEVCEDHL